VSFFNNVDKVLIKLTYLLEGTPYYRGRLRPKEIPFSGFRYLS